MMMLLPHHIKKQDERGLVSIVVVTIVIIILALMTAGFAKIMDRELRQSLDRELAVQANYATESGMNDARRYLASGQAVSTSGDCLDTANLSGIQPQYFVANGNISGDANQTVKYTCINLDTSPNELVTTVKQGQSKVFKVASADTIDQLFFSWNNSGAGAKTGSTGLLATGEFPAESFWNSAANKEATGVLRTTIYQVPSGASATDPTTDKNGLLENLARNYFMYPNSGGSNQPGQATIAENGVNVQGNCKQTNYSSSPSSMPINTKYFCNSVITNLGPVAPSPPPPPPPIIILGKDYISCTDDEPDAYNALPCTKVGNGVEYQQNYTATYQVNNPAPGNYNLAIDWSNFNSTAWPPTGAGASYGYNVTFLVNGVGLNSATLANSGGTVNGIGLVLPTANATIDVKWTNNIWIACGANPKCYDPNLQINKLTLNQIVAPPPAPSANAFYYVKLTALYRDLSVSIQGVNTSNNPVSFIKAQGTVDVTAKGNDVLKRLQGHISLEPDYNYPSFAVDSMDTLCKRIRVQKTGSGTFGSTGYQDPASTNSNVNTACSAGGPQPTGSGILAL
jgi:Tfp pilus assembly protein PilX